MRRSALPLVFILLLALNAAGFALFAFDLDGRTVVHKKSVIHTETRVPGRPR